MRTLIYTVLAGGLLASPALAQNSGGGPQGVLQGLLSGNQNQDQAVRDAYERGYQKGRQDEARLGSNDRGGNRSYGNDNRGYIGNGSGNGYGNGGNSGAPGYSPNRNN